MAARLIWLKYLTHSLFARTFLTGDILSWETVIWNLTTPWNSSEMEILDFEKDVCANSEVGTEAIRCGSHQKYFREDSS